MASDQIVWDIINQQFCSFKLRTVTGAFCRNEYNVTGLCSRQSCPLANSRYATIRFHGERVYLYMKTVERAHMPSKLWERIKLSQNYATALKQIDERLIYWPKFLVHKCKQRLTKTVQMLIRARRVAAEEARLGERLVPKLAPKVRRREEARERKALAAAKIERSIERELLERLRQGAYGDEQPLNVSEDIWRKVLNNLEREGTGVRDQEADEDEDEDEEEREVERELEKEDGDEGEMVTEYVSDFEESDEELGDIEDWLGSEEADGEDVEDESEEDARQKVKAKVKGKTGRVVRKKKAARKEVEVETEAQAIKLLAY